jgi:hypothetical protein
VAFVTIRFSSQDWRSRTDAGKRASQKTDRQQTELRQPTLLNALLPLAPEKISCWTGWQGKIVANIRCRSTDAIPQLNARQAGTVSTAAGRNGGHPAGGRVAGQASTSVAAGRWPGGGTADGPGGARPSPASALESCWGGRGAASWRCCRSRRAASVFEDVAKPCARIRRKRTSYPRSGRSAPEWSQLGPSTEETSKLTSGHHGAGHDRGDNKYMNS